MVNLDVEGVKKQAQKEIDEERFREAVDKRKEYLKQKRWYHLPFKIVRR